MAIIETKHYPYKDFYKYIYDNYDIMSVKCLSFLNKIPPGNYVFTMLKKNALE
jgi:hypothetical protein